MLVLLFKYWRHLWKQYINARVHVHANAATYVINRKRCARCFYKDSVSQETSKQRVLCLQQFTMSLLCMIVCKVWDVYVTNAVLSGLWISRMNGDNSSLVFSWMVFLCDLVYITDSFARSTKRVFQSAITMDLELLYDHESAPSILALFATTLTSLTFVPYHFLVILAMDMSYVYYVVCVLRLARLWRSGRLDVVSIRSRKKKRQHLRTSQQTQAKKEVKTGHSLQRSKENQDIEVWRELLSNNCWLSMTLISRFWLTGKWFQAQSQMQKRWHLELTLLYVVFTPPVRRFAFFCSSCY